MQKASTSRQTVSYRKRKTSLKCSASKLFISNPSLNLLNYKHSYQLCCLYWLCHSFCQKWNFKDYKLAILIGVPESLSIKQEMQHCRLTPSLLKAPGCLSREQVSLKSEAETKSFNVQLREASTIIYMVWNLPVFGQQIWADALWYSS